MPIEQAPSLRFVETIIIGGGPAGSTCAAALKKNSRDVLILDKAAFPREKLCAGWITEKVMADLAFSPDDYPHSIMKVDIRSHVKGFPFSFGGLATPGANYSIRRVEFDRWLLERSGAEVQQHEVRDIRYEGGSYMIDDQFSCRNLVGAGGTSCPVRRLFFPENRRKFRQVVTLEREFAYPQRSDVCHLYFGHYGTKGYAWYFPKANGYLNVGLGGKANYFKQKGFKIHALFSRFMDDLVKQRLLDAQTATELKKSGHPYYLNSGAGEIRRDGCFLIGDAAGLATVDLGEGIGPAIESGLMTAGEIMGTDSYSKARLTQISTAGLLGKLARRFVAPASLRNLH